MIKIRRAIISVSDKNGIVELAKFLSESGVEILSTGDSKSFKRKQDWCDRCFSVAVFLKYLMAGQDPSPQNLADFYLSGTTKSIRDR